MITEEEKKILLEHKHCWDHYVAHQVFTGFTPQAMAVIAAIYEREFKLKFNHNCSGCVVSGTRMVYNLLKNEEASF